MPTLPVCFWQMQGLAMAGRYSRCNEIFFYQDDCDLYRKRKRDKVQGTGSQAYNLKTGTPVPCFLFLVASDIYLMKGAYIKVKKTKLAFIYKCT